MKRKSAYQLGHEHGSAGLKRYPHRKQMYELPNKRVSYEQGYIDGCARKPYPAK